MARDTSAVELRAVAPLVVLGGKAPQLVGPCTLVTNGSQVIAFSSAELLRKAGEPLAIALTMDASQTLPVTAWTMSRSPHMGIIDLGTSFPIKGAKLDVEPVNVGKISATVDTKGAPSALVTIVMDGDKITRHIVNVHVDNVDGGMSDEIIARLASPDEPIDLDTPIDGAALVSWLPPDPVLGRKAETVIVALSCPYVTKAFKPRELPAIGELFGLEDLGRALPFQPGPKQEGSNELGQVAGEIKEVESGPLAGIDIDVDGD